MKHKLQTYRSTLLVAAAAAILLGACAVPPRAAPAAPAAQAPAAQAPAVQPTEAPKAEAAPTEAPKQEAAAPKVLKIVATESKASYIAQKTLLKNNTGLEVVGTTGGVSGEIVLDTANPSNTKVGEISVDLLGLVSDNDKRDGDLKTKWLESAKFPTAKFVNIKIEGLPTSYKVGDELKFKMMGDLTIHETTKPTAFDVSAKFDGSMLTGEASTVVKISDFGFEAPSAVGIMSVADEIGVKLAIVAR
jgi:polyisoprenoid-binding protein YceI